MIVENNSLTLYNGIEKMNIKFEARGIDSFDSRAGIFLKTDEYSVVDRHDGPTKTYLWKPGMFAYVPPDQLFSVELPDNKVSTHALFVPKRLNAELNEINSAAQVFRGVVDELTFMLFMSLYGLLPDDDPLLVDHVSLALFRSIRRWRSPVEVYSNSSIRIKTVVEYMNDNLDKRLTTKELSSVACASQFHFIRKFTALIGLSPHRYMTRIRIQRAKEKLSEGKLSIAAIAYVCGFSNQSHMTNLFRSATGKTPGQFRLLAGVRSSVQELC